jgi:hypothetical protein
MMTILALLVGIPSLVKISAKGGRDKIGVAKTGVAI